MYDNYTIMTQDKIILHIQNATLFAIANMALIASIYFYMTNSQFGFRCIDPLLISYSIIDLYINRSFEVKIHHIFTMCILFYKYYYSINDSDMDLITYTIMTTEVTSIFYISRFYLPKKSVLYFINNAFFYVLYLKLRMIDYFFNVIHWDSQLYLLFDKYTPNSIGESSIIVIGCYGLYGLNLYWFYSMNRILYDGIFPSSIQNKKMT